MLQRIRTWGNNTGSAAAPSYNVLSLTSADFANQGTTTTVLHGNAAGNPSFSAVSLSSDVTGNLPVNKLNSRISIHILAWRRLMGSSGGSA
jgi:hypothetical protein